MYERILEKQLCVGTYLKLRPWYIYICEENHRPVASHWQTLSHNVVYRALIVCCGRDGMVIWFTSNCAFSAYHHWRCEFESHSWRGVLDTTSCDKVYQWLVTGRWFSPVFSTNKTDHHDTAEILLKVALSTIAQTPPCIYNGNLK